MRTEKGSRRWWRGHWWVQREVLVAWFQWLGWKLTGVGLGGNEVCESGESLENFHETFHKGLKYFFKKPVHILPYEGWTNLKWIFVIYPSPTVLTLELVNSCKISLFLCLDLYVIQHKLVNTVIKVRTQVIFSVTWWWYEWEASKGREL